jgi:signal transduction histidine kinase
VPEHLDLIEAEIDTSERVIADLLQMTRTKPLHWEWTDLRTLLGDAAARVHLPEQIPLRLEFSPEPFRVWADYVQLRQVLINVLTNAVEAIGQVGTITIRAKQLTTDETCIIEIVDTGSGISPEGLRKVFEPLYTTKATGTGLGLSICRQIIESHHGQITLMSQLGRGTTVTIVLPHQTKGDE